MGSEYKRAGFLMVICLALSMILILFLSPSPLKGLQYFLIKPFSSPMNGGNTLNKFTLLLLSASAVLLSFRGGEFNLGGEGQICLGGMVTLFLLIPLDSVSGFWGITLALVLSFVVGGLMGWLIGFLKVSFSVSEVLSSYISSLIVMGIFSYVVSGPLKDRESYLITTKEIPRQFQFETWMKPSQLNGSLIVALALTLVLYLFLFRNRIGFEWRLGGSNSHFAQYCGINTGRNTMAVLATSGALYGLTGAIAVMGTYHRGLVDFYSGYGWNGMAVSLMAGHNPLLLIPSSLFFSHLSMGSDMLNLLGRINIPLNDIIVAFTFLLVTAGRRKRA